MSADRWSLCPSCVKKANNDLDNARKILADSYGKVSLAEYTKLQLKIATLEVEMAAEVHVLNTLREDWELGTDKVGTFYVSYRSACTTCKHSFNFKHEEMAL